MIRTNLNETKEESWEKEDSRETGNGNLVSAVAVGRQFVAWGSHLPCCLSMRVLPILRNPPHLWYTQPAEYNTNTHTHQDTAEHCNCVAAITHQPLHSPALAIHLLGTPSPEGLFTLSYIKLRQGQYETDQDALHFPHLSPARLSPSFAPRRTAFVPHPFSPTLCHPNTHARPPSIYPLPQAYAS